MLDLARWSPSALHREMDEVFRRFFGDACRQSRLDRSDSMPTWWPAVESSIQNGTLGIRVALPGVDPKDVDVSVTDQTLTVRESRNVAREGLEGGYFHRELACVSFERSFTIPDGVDPAQVNAKYSHGMLKISVPAPQLAAPKKIEIELDGQASGRKQITA